jgi:hypothetical protein
LECARGLQFFNLIIKLIDGPFRHCYLLNFNLSVNCMNRMIHRVPPGLISLVIKLGRPDGWIGPCLIKDQPGQQPGKTRSTRRINPWPGQTRCFFFSFQIWDLKFISIYAICSQKKKIMFFQCGIKNFLI